MVSIDLFIDEYVEAATIYRDTGTSYSDVEIPLLAVGEAVVRACGRYVDTTQIRVEQPAPSVRSGKATISSAIRWDVWERDGFTCQHCGIQRDLSVDHIVAESRGGTLEMDNLQTLCRSCNSRKGTSAPADKEESDE